MSEGGPPVLVVTRLDDATADEVITELNRRRVPVVRLDPGDFPTEVTLSGTFDSIGPGGTIATTTRTLDLGNVESHCRAYVASVTFPAQRAGVKPGTCVSDA